MDYSLAGQTEEGLASETRWIKGLDIINIHKEQCMVAMGHNNPKTLMLKLLTKEMTGIFSKLSQIKKKITC